MFFSLLVDPIVTAVDKLCNILVLIFDELNLVELVSDSSSIRHGNSCDVTVAKVFVESHHQECQGQGAHRACSWY